MNDLVCKKKGFAWAKEFCCRLFVWVMLLSAAHKVRHEMCILVVQIPMSTLAFPQSLPNTLPLSHPRMYCVQWI